MKDEHIIVTPVRENMTKVLNNFLKNKVSFGAQFGTRNNEAKRYTNYDGRILVNYVLKGQQFLKFLSLKDKFYQTARQNNFEF